MSIQVLATISWHTGLPDGEETVAHLMPDFDIYDKSECYRLGQHALELYGVNGATIDYHDDLMHMPTSYAFIADMGRFDRKHPAGIPPHIMRCEVEVTFSYVWCHRDRIFTLSEYEGAPVFT